MFTDTTTIQNAEELVLQFHNLGIVLWREEDRLCFDAPEGVLTEDLVETLRKNKAGILAFFQEARASSAETGAEIRKVERTGDPPLSFAQQRLWFLNQLEERQINYNLPFAIGFRGLLDVCALAQAFEKLMDRHEILRTSFPARDGLPRQWIHQTANPAWAVIDLAGLEEPCQQLLAESLLALESGLPFNMAQGPLLRVTLLRLLAGEHLLAVTLHHIVADGWSNAILIQELACFYQSCLKELPAPLPDLAIQYADYALWQRRFLEGEALETQLAYWRQVLRDAPDFLKLPRLRRPEPGKGPRGRVTNLTLDRELTEGLRNLCAQADATLFITLQAVFSLLLSRYCGQTDVLIGTPLANRNRVEIQPLIGFFVNTVALRTKMTDTCTGTKHLAHTRQTVLEAFQHGEVPFEKVVEAVRPQRKSNQNPLVQVMFVVETESKEMPVLPGLELAGVEAEAPAVKFDLVLTVNDLNDSLNLALSYSPDLFEDPLIRQMARHFRQLCREIMAFPQRRLSRLSPLTGEERRKLIRSWQETPTDYAGSTPVHERFQNWAERDPDAVAATHRQTAVSYGALQRRARVIMNTLRQKGIGPGDFVPLMMEADTDRVAAALGTLMAGAAYVPMDPDWPDERLAFLLQDIAAVKAIAQDGSRLPPTVDVMDVTDFIGVAPSPRAVTVGAKAPAYVIYTSGSTGRPKGVVVGHRAISRLVCRTDYIRIWPGDRFAQAANMAFDAATFEIWGALLNGASTCLASKVTTLEPRAFSQFLKREAITVLFLTTALFNTLCREEKDASQRLRVLLFGGEAVDRDTVSSFLADKKRAQLLHVYGPTENTTFSTWFPVESVAANDMTVPIGFPIANSSAYVLDSSLQPVPAGAPGQLWVGGDGVAQGYLKRPALTAAAFIPHPYARRPGDRLYRSGDRVTHLPPVSEAPGPLIFLNRMDQQIKLRGFRIELGEVETCLQSHDQVGRAVALAGEDSLWAFVGGSPGIQEKELRAFLAARLPAFMVPNRIIPVAEWPLTPNRKVDRKALWHLLARERAGDSRTAVCPPQTPLQEKLAQIWREILGLERLSIHDNFFELGGHSLLATRVVSRIRKKIAPHLPLRVLFETPTLAGLAERITALEADQVRSLLPPLRPQTVRGKGPYQAPMQAPMQAPLSFAQQRLWFLDQMDRGKEAYTVFFAMELEGPWSSQALEDALNIVVERHHSLRTVFHQAQGQPWQQVLPHVPRPVPFIDLNGFKLLNSLIAAEGGRTFDLVHGPLLRTTLIRVGPQTRVLLITMHHLISDGWSAGVMVRETSANYRDIIFGEPRAIETLAFQYTDFAIWQRSIWNHEAFERQRQGWKTRLEGAPHWLELPSKPRATTHDSREAGEWAFSFSPILSNRVKNLALAADTTLFVLLQSVFAALLARYSGQAQVLVGTPIANRHHPELEPLIGFLVNTLVLRNDLRHDPSFHNLLKVNREFALFAFANQDLPFDHLVELLAPDRDLHQNPLFRTMFAWQNAPVDPPKWGSARMRLLDAPTTSAKFDLTLAMLETPGRDTMIQGLFEYRKAVFDSRLMRRMLRHFRILLEGAIDRPDLPMSRLSLFGSGERHLMLVEWNDRHTCFPRDQTVHQIFDMHTAKGGDALALRVRAETRTPGAHATYAGLAHRANHLAANLRKMGMGPDRLIGIFLDRSSDLYAAHLAVLKSGAAYVPLDPQTPTDRLEWMFRDLGLLITKGTLLPRLPAKHPPILNLDRLAHSLPFRDTGVQPENLAYVMYTSGSTGKPKGVAITHLNILRLVLETDYLKLDREDRMVQAANPIFDAATFEIWSPLLQGAAVVAIPATFVADARKMAYLLREEWISTMVLITALFHHLARENAAMFRGLRNLFFGGEQADPHLVRKVLAAGAPGRLVHLYGPTESTTLASWHTVENFDSTALSVPIGTPISNTGLYLTDAKLHPVAQGVHGQLLIGGEGLARGYLKNPTRTAECFVPNPFSARAGDRLYRTGDLVHIQTGGRLDFIGRTDHQIKFRGYRIELGEIENVLLGHPGVGLAVVVFHKGAVNHIVAYLSWDRHWSGKHRISEIKSFISNKLPGYMIPAKWVILEKMPLTPTGKIDRGALPKPETSRELAQAPSGPEEEKLAAIFSEVLNQKEIGARDNFFELGGHSLLAARAMARINESFAVQLPLQSLFRTPTVVGMAKHLASAQRTQMPPVLPVPRIGLREFPLSHAQRRLWLLDKLEGASAAYHIPIALELKGLLDPRALETALRALLNRHDSLRTRFGERDGIPFQVVEDTADYDLKTIDLRGLPEHGRHPRLNELLRAGAVRAFDLSRGPLVRHTLIHYGKEKHVLSVVMHHIITDGWSMSLLTRELSDVYAANLHGLPSPLKKHTLQYVDYADWQQKVMEGLLGQRIAYWKKTLDGAPACHDLPTDFPRPLIQTYDGTSLSFNLGGDLSPKLSALASARGLTVFMVLQTLLAVILSRFGNQEDVLFGTPVANRPQKALESVIGFFVNTLVLRHDLSGHPRFSVLLERVRQKTLEAFDHQEAPFEKVVDEIQPERSLAHSPLFQVFLVWQNLPETGLLMPGLSLGMTAVPQKAAKFDLSLNLEETPAGIGGTLTYNTRLFQPGSMKLWVVYFKRLAAFMVNHPEKRIHTVDWLEPDERRTLLLAWDQSAQADLHSANALDAFLNQAQHGPDRIALFQDGCSLSFRWLEQNIQRTAHRLLIHGATRETPVALCAGRTAETVIAMLAVLRSGAFFVPLDLSWPDLRRQQILRETGARLLIKGRELRMNDRTAVPLIARRQEGTCSVGQALPELPILAANLAYVVFTSGTSGGPKGVAIPHRALANYISGILKLLGPEPGASFALVSSPAADLGFTALFPALASGGLLHLLSEDAVRDARRFAHYFRRHPIDILKIVPSHLEALGESLQPGRLVRQLLILGGEATRQERVVALRSTLKSSALMNHYGPTEATVGMLTLLLTPAAPVPTLPTLPLDSPLPGARVFLTGRTLTLQPAGMPGELCIGGSGLARQYLNRPDLTATAFVPDPFGAIGERIYKSGDRVRLVGDLPERGSYIEFLGRFDAQIKIRGFRVEITEIEARLASYPRVNKAVVVLSRRFGEPQLVGFFVPATDKIDVNGLRTWLRQGLPSYMVPARLAKLDTLPLAPNGKPDRRRLETMVLPAERPDPGQDLPKGPIEAGLASIWRRVLERDDFTMGDSFFDLGGHSLLATRVVARIREELGRELPLKTIFRLPSIKELGAYLETTARDAPTAALPPIVALAGKETPLSHAQKRLWFLDQLEGPSTTYSIPQTMRFSGCFDIRALENGIVAMVNRHQVLRTHFPAREGVPVQVIGPDPLPGLSFYDLAHLPASDSLMEAEGIVARDSAWPFILAEGPLFRVRLIRLAGDDHVLFFNMHHMVSDGWSWGIMVGELTYLYKALVLRRPLPLPPLPVQYADFAQWQTQMMDEGLLAEQLIFWKTHLEGAPPLLNLPTDRPRPAAQTFNGQVVTSFIDKDTAAALRELCRKNQTTLFMTLQTSFALLLARFGGQDDIVLGTPIANRHRREIEPLIGFFANTLAMRLRPRGHLTLADLLQRARNISLDAFANQDIPFESVVEALQPKRSLSHSPVFQVVFLLQNARGVRAQLPGLTPIEMRTRHVIAKFDLTLSVVAHTEGLTANWEFNRDLFDATTVSRMAKSWQRLLAGMPLGNDQPVRCLSLQSPVERHRLLQEWQHTHAARESGMAMDRFEAVAHQRPEAVALSTEAENRPPTYMTYDFVRSQIDLRARGLTRRGATQNEPVGLMMARSAEAVVMLLGILRSGNAYLPLDPSLPPKRLAFMLEDSGAKLVVTTEREHWAEATPACHFVEPAAIMAEATARDAPMVPPESGDLAYIIYTSGSTGSPKGAMLPHRGLVNLALEQIARFGTTSQSRILQFASLGFDASVSELLMAFLSGGLLHLPTAGEVFAGDSLAFLLQRQAITHVTLPPSVAGTIPPEMKPCLRGLILAGEACNPELAAFFAKHTHVFNAYGPTETTVCLSIARVDETNPISLGRPIGNWELYVLGQDLAPVPPGVAGELCAGGIGLARGYLKRPDLTAEKFLPHPFSRRAGARIYRTGDLTKFLADGKLQFLGRSDYQIKLRGYRVEPGEVESVLGRHPHVREAAVLYHTGGGWEGLVAWLVVDAASELAASARFQRTMKSFCAEFLPDHMHPRALIPIREFPRTNSGKIDRKALGRLPIPDNRRTRVGGESFRKLPANRLEAELVGIWREIFQIESIGVHDHFFALGGHSLLAARVISQIRRTLKIAVPLRALFEAPTPAALARRLEHLRRESLDPSLPPITAGGRAKTAPLSHAQQRMWFIHHWEGQDQVYHIPIVREIRGHLSVPCLERGMMRVLTRHDILRTHFPTMDGDPVQACRSLAAWSLTVIDESQNTPLKAEATDRLVRAFISSRFDMERGPLWRLLLLRSGERRHTLAWVVHHIIFDGWSADILLRELAVSYESIVLGREPELPDLPIQYADFSRWQRDWLRGDRLAAKLAFWKAHLQCAPALVDLPADQTRPAAKTFRGANLPFTVPDHLASKLRVLGREAGVTPFTLLNAAFALLLSRYSGQDHVVIGTPVACRDRWEIEPLIGFFVNTLALHIDLSGNPHFLKLVRQVHETMLEALAQQDLPFEKLVEELKPQRGLSYTPIFQVLFTLQKLDRGPVSLPGLRLESHVSRSEGARFDLALFMADGHGLGGVFEYSTDIFRGATIRRMADHYTHLLGELAANPQQSIAALEWMTPDERAVILAEINQTDAAYPDRSCIDTLFEIQVGKNPGAVALVGLPYSDGSNLQKEEFWTYLAVNRAADRLAASLRTRGIGAETVVGLFLDRSPQTIAALLAILKGGGAYLPLDPDLPSQRRRELLEDAGAVLVLTRQKHRHDLRDISVPVLELDETIAAPANPEPAYQRTQRPALSAAYVIYTSGSTGKPKGVVIPHRAVVRLLYSQNYVEIGPSSSVLHMAPLAFDASTFEIWGPLLAGGRCVLYPEKVPSITRLDQVLQATRIDTLWLTASLFNLIIEERAEMLAGVRQLLAGGEALSITHVKRAMEALPHTRIINGYGPTENTTFTCCLPIKSRELNLTASVPIGPPLANTRLEVLDAHGGPVARGLPGELLIGGAGLARAYLGDAGATAASFIPDGWSGRWGERLYRSGDRARILDGGLIEFLGRLDRQVKISGFRIELGEIETTLTNHPKVGQAVALLRETPLRGKQLACYVVPHHEKNRQPQVATAKDNLTAVLTDYLRTRLPAYMVPSFLMVLDRFPLTRNGKLDTARLPHIPRDNPSKTIALPQNQLQHQIAKVWREVLALETVDIEENFFDLGGQSLLLIKVHAKLKQTLGLDFPLVTLFRYTTIASLAAHLGAGNERESTGKNAAARAQTMAARKSGLQRRKQRIRAKRRSRT